MSPEQLLIVGILCATVGLFLWGRWRHDMVAAAALLACVFTGLVPYGNAFAGFAHPAVITVACVLVLSHGLQVSGAVDALTRRVLPAKSGPTLSILMLTTLVALLSAFMNNVGALALLIPVAMQLATRLNLPPGKLLMPLAFGSILGGTTTLIGTPTNLIVSGLRDEAGLGGFDMFDFTPVGLALTALGVVFIGLIGWRLVPARAQAGTESFDTGAYLTEARVPEGSKAAGMKLREIETALEEAEAQIVGLVRNEVQMLAPNPGRYVHAGDILIIEAEAETLANALSSLGLVLEQARHQAKKEEAADPVAEEDAEKEKEKAPPSDEIVLVELAILPTSGLLERTPSDIQLRSRFGINLLAVSSQGQRSRARLRTYRFKAGDVLMMQGTPEAIAEFAGAASCVPLAERALRIPDRRKAITASVIMGLAVAAAAVGLLPIAVAFAAGVLASMVLRTVPPRSVYEAVDWPVIVLLGSLIPVAAAMQSTGTADLIARFLLESVAQGHAILALAVILVVTMTLSDLMNNAATAAVMCPIALGAAGRLDANPDTFLMAVAIGASCAFLTPIGHQNNTLILGPGGFRFGDYWRLGLPLEILLVAVSIPMLLWVWPL
ncbi:MAG: SLC13 family permease [Gammaproteobacteria bacterium]|nr:SLC13 family permease [Gammaproteobacteria bacterium]MBU1408782.1 SLC13 family permease [Gammaproteobacteria bacterium]MBU1532619.1 SLC13 family permease [Gammaproteobacteria bacterium]